MQKTTSPTIRCFISHSYHPKQVGFTLIELMITVTIIAILASVALPAYTDYVRRAKASEAVAELSSWRGKMEQFFLDNRTYLSGSDCGIAASTGKGYTYSCTATVTSYTLTATSVTSNEGTYTVSESDQRNTTSFKGSTVTDKRCWLIRGDEC